MLFTSQKVVIVKSTASTPLSRSYLLSCLHFPVAVQEVAPDDGADDGQTLSRLQLRGEGEQTRIFHMEVLIELQQHKQLRSVVEKSQRHSMGAKRSGSKGLSLHPC